MGAGGVMGGCSSRSTTVDNSTNKKEVSLSFDMEEKPYNKPKNDFEMALNELDKNQTIDNYQVQLIKNGFTSKARKKNGKIILKLKNKR